MRLPKSTKTTLLFIALFLLVIAPSIASDYFIIMAIRVMYFGMLTLSLGYLASELGVVSLMQASFFGIAGYFIAILQTRYHIPFPIPPLVGIVVAGMFASLCGLLVIRVRGIYFLMLTLVLGPAHLGPGQPVGLHDPGRFRHHRHFRPGDTGLFTGKIQRGFLHIRADYLLRGHLVFCARSSARPLA